MSEMDIKFKSILDELCDYAPLKDRDTFIESRAQQVMASAKNLLRLISESYDADTASDLSKRLVRAISTGDEEKFGRGLRNVRATQASKNIRNCK